MYIPNRYRVADFAQITAFMQAHRFAAVVSVTDGSPVASHLPLTARVSGETVWLQGHFARANPQWRGLDGSEVMVIFTGPHAYVSPTLYDKQESVPTWNYLAVHAYGTVRLIDSKRDKDQLLQVIAELVAQNEPAYQTQWDALPDKYRDGMMAAIVGFEVEITRLEAAAKLSQNKSVPEQWRIGAALVESDQDEVRETGRIMLQRLRDVDQ